MVRAIAAPRRVMAEILAMRPGEGALLGMVAVSCLLWFLGRWAQVSLAGATGDEAVGRVQAEFVTSIFFRALGLYLLAGLCGLAARVAGGAGSWRDSRAATFWAALVSAPVSLFGVLLAIAVTDPLAASALRSAGGVLFAWLLAMNLAEAHGFRSGAKVLAVLAALLLAFALIPAVIA